jgi:large subunit ribosomal protein L1
MCLREIRICQRDEGWKRRRAEPGEDVLVEEAMDIVKKAPRRSSTRVSIRRSGSVDPKHATRWSVSHRLPHGIGKTVRVAVFAKGEKEREAREAGADVVGAEDLVEKIQVGFMDFDSTIATPDLMGQVGRLGKVLGPRGLMPNPKMGTVTFDVGRAVREIKAGKVEFRVDKAGNVHVQVGRKSFPQESLVANAMALLEAIVKAKPAASKGVYLRSLTLSTTMGPGTRWMPSGSRTSSRNRSSRTKERGTCRLKRKWRASRP